MAIASAIDTGYLRMCQIAQCDRQEGARQAEELNEEIKGMSIRMLAAQLVNEAYKGNKEKLELDLSKVAILAPDVKLSEDEALHLLMLVWKMAGSSFDGRTGSLLWTVESLRWMGGGVSPV